MLAHASQRQLVIAEVCEIHHASLRRQQPQAHAHHSTTTAHVRTSLLHLRRIFTCTRSCCSPAELVSESSNALGTSTDDDHRITYFEKRISQSIQPSSFGHVKGDHKRQRSESEADGGGIWAAMWETHLRQQGYTQSRLHTDDRSIGMPYKTPSHSQNTHLEELVLIQQASPFASSIISESEVVCLTRDRHSLALLGLIRRSTGVCRNTTPIYIPSSIPQSFRNQCRSSNTGSPARREAESQASKGAGATAVDINAGPTTPNLPQDNNKSDRYYRGARTLAAGNRRPSTNSSMNRDPRRPSISVQRSEKQIKSAQARCMVQSARKED